MTLARRSRLDSAGVRALLVVLAVLFLPGVALAAPGLLDGSDAPERPASRAGWLVAQSPAPSPAVSAELIEIDQRIAEVMRDRPTTARVTAGVALTALGGVTLAGGAAVFIAFLSLGGWGAAVAILFGLPVMLVGVGLLIPGIVLWVTGLSGQRDADEELATLRERRARLISSPPAADPNVPPETIPQVWRDGPRPGLALARF